jgi:hypothetical protein
MRLPGLADPDPTHHADGRVGWARWHLENTGFNQWNPALALRERNGLIERTPGARRSIKGLLPRHELPDLE